MVFVFHENKDVARVHKGTGRLLPRRSRKAFETAVIEHLRGVCRDWDTHVQGRPDGPALKLNPRNFRSCGCATALFASFTLSLSFCVMNRVTLSITRCPARSLQNIDITVVRVSNETMAPALQLSV